MINEQKIFSIWLIPILCVVIAFLHGLFLYGAASGRDDPYITYWAAQALSDFGKIVNYNGEAVEQSSSLLHVILLAILYKISNISMPVLGVFFSAMMGALTILAAWRLAIFLNLKAAWFVALFLALFPYLVYLSFSGLETTLVAFIVVLLVYSVIRFLTEKISFSLLIFIILSIGAYILSRPEAIFCDVSISVGNRFVFHRSSFFPQRIK
ncbi:membrane protein [Beggiatoa sp. PS]|nr:membrane protein [Beggiatoa sp. PS]